MQMQFSSLINPVVWWRVDSPGGAGLAEEKDMI